MPEPTHAKEHHLRMAANRAVSQAAEHNFTITKEEAEAQIRESLILHAAHSELSPADIEGLVGDLLRLAVWKRRTA